MSRLPFKIKICGVTNVEDAQAVVRAGADAIGLNFYSRSKRFVPMDAAAKLASAVSEHCFKVGVFVNPTLAELYAALARFFAGQTRLDAIQLHGSEPPDFLQEVTKLRLPIIRAFRWDQDGGQPIQVFLRKCAQLDCLPSAILIDSHKPGEFGGTGDTADWDAIAQWRDQSEFDIPLVLAGGLTPDNVAEAIAQVRPDAVDAASGVEVSPGRKDPGKIAAFVAAAKQAFAAISE
jgi:phosphoribosylanthranilate isomerase